MSYSPLSPLITPSSSWKTAFTASDTCKAVDLYARHERACEPIPTNYRNGVLITKRFAFSCNGHPAMQSMPLYSNAICWLSHLYYLHPTVSAVPLLLHRPFSAWLILLTLLTARDPTFKTICIYSRSFDVANIGGKFNLSREKSLGQVQSFLTHEPPAERQCLRPPLPSHSVLKAVKALLLRLCNWTMRIRL
jgi:hypothetical protein